MSAATNQQVQNFSDQQVRPICNTVVALHAAIVSALAQISDVYANLTSSSTWTDGRIDGPPHLATPNDVLAWNTFATDLKTAIEGDAQWAIIQNLSTRVPNPNG